MFDRNYPLSEHSVSVRLAELESFYRSEGLTQVETLRLLSQWCCVF